MHTIRRGSRKGKPSSDTDRPKRIPSECVFTGRYCLMKTEKDIQIRSAGVEPSGGRARTPHHGKEDLTEAERSTATAAGQLWQAAGHEPFAGYDTCVDHESHRGTPRHEHGERPVSPMERHARRRLEASRLYTVIINHPRRYERGFCRIKKNEFHGETLLGGNNWIEQQNTARTAAVRNAANRRIQCDNDLFSRF